MPTYYNNLPSVRRREFNVSNVLTTRQGNTVGIAGYFPNGRIRRPVVVSDPSSFLNTFGYPTITSASTVATGTGTTNSVPKVIIPDYGYGSYAVLQQLTETANVIVVRAVAVTDYYANTTVKFNALSSASYPVTYGTSAYQSIPAKAYVTGDPFDTDKYLASVESAGVPAGSDFMVSYTSPTSLGNNYSVTVETFSSACDWVYSYDDYPTVALSAAFATSGAVTSAFPIGSQVIKVSVYQKSNDKQWTDLYANANDKSSGYLRQTPIETYYGTVKRDVKYRGQSIFLEDVINGVSPNIYVNVAASPTLPPVQYTGANNVYKIVTSADSFGTYVDYNAMRLLSNGSYAAKNEIATPITSEWDIFRNKKDVTIDLLVNPSWNKNSKIATANVVADRIDSFAELQVNEPQYYTVDNIIANETYGYVAPSYVGLNVGFSKIFDGLNNRDVYVPNSIFAGVVDLRTLRTGQPWLAPAGVNRAIIPVTDQLKRYSDSEMDRLIGKNFNTVAFEPGYGFAFNSQRTAQLKSSALNRKNVRFDLLYIENNIEAALKSFLFENNTPQTRLRVYTLCDEFLSGVKAAGGVENYAVVCDSSNNTATVISTNQMNVNIGIIPPYSAEYINLNVLVAKSGSDINSITITQV